MRARVEDEGSGEVGEEIDESEDMIEGIEGSRNLDRKEMEEREVAGEGIEASDEEGTPVDSDTADEEQVTKSKVISFSSMVPLLWPSLGKTEG